MNNINNVLRHKSGAAQYTHIKVGRNKSYFINDALYGYNEYTANDICKMIEFLLEKYTCQVWWTAFLTDGWYSYGLLEISNSHAVTLMTLSLTIIKDLGNSFLISTPKKLTIFETT